MKNEISSKLQTMKDRILTFLFLALLGGSICGIVTKAKKMTTTEQYALLYASIPVYLEDLLIFPVLFLVTQYLYGKLVDLKASHKLKKIHSLLLDSDLQELYVIFLSFGIIF